MCVVRSARGSGRYQGDGSFDQLARRQLGTAGPCQRQALELHALLSRPGGWPRARLHQEEAAADTEPLPDLGAQERRSLRVLGHRFHQSRGGSEHPSRLLYHFQ